MFTGNALRQSAFKGIKTRRAPQGYPNADLVMRGSLLIGCHHGLTPRHIDYMKEIFVEFLEKHTA